MLYLILKYLPVDDPWERFAYHFPVHFFGAGSERDFTWYFEGESAVKVTSIEDVQNWLLECEYASDMHVFQRSDYWQHPRTFEHLRKGDCEDHALWAWRKLVELGHDAEFVSGHQLAASRVSDEDSGHAWVVIRRDDELVLFEAAAKSRDSMLRPLNAGVRAEYRPEFGIDAKHKRHGYFGRLLTLKERRDRKKLRTV